MRTLAPGWGLRPLLFAAVAATGMLAALPAPSPAAVAKPVVDAPKVRGSAVVITRGGQRRLLVKSLTIFHPHEVNVRATCRNCLRLPSPKPRQLQPARGITRFTGLNWVLDFGLHIRVYVTAPGSIGRFVLLGPAKPIGRQRLVVEGEGCRENGTPVHCAEDSPPPATDPASGITYPETVGGDTETWTDYTNAGGLGGAVIRSGQTVEVSCVVRGFAVANGNPWWYRIASSPWNNSYYASADAFYNNGQTTGSLVGTPWVDEAVPPCGN